MLKGASEEVPKSIPGYLAYGQAEQRIWTGQSLKVHIKLNVQILNGKHIIIFFSYWTVIRHSSKMASQLTQGYSKDQNWHVSSATWWNQPSVSLALCSRHAAALSPIYFFFCLPMIKGTFIRYLSLWKQNARKLCERK